MRSLINEFRDIPEPEASISVVVDVPKTPSPPTESLKEDQPETKLEKKSPQPQKKTTASKNKLAEKVKKRIITGYASWYGPGFHGRRTANGEIYNMYDMTAAHKSLPFNTMLKVTNLENSNSIVVRINDRGPYINGRILDLSKAAAQKLGVIEPGVIQVNLEIMN